MNSPTPAVEGAETIEGSRICARPSLATDAATFELPLKDYW